VTSAFAEFVLAVSIPLMIGVFFLMRPARACLLVALGGDLFLPEGPTYHIPWLPALGKHNLIYVCVLIGCLLQCPGRVTKLPKERWFLGLCFAALVGGIIMGLTNSDVLIFGRAAQVTIPAMTVKDGIGVAIVELFPSCVAFYLGYQLFRGQKDVENALADLGLAGLVYSLFAIVEMRMSPQFHQWIYGYAMGAFDQTIRWGGYRPMVFMPHGLALARFFLATTLALFVLAKTRSRLLGMPVRLLAWYHAVVLVLCKSTGAIVLFLVGILLIQFAKPKRQLLLASILAISTITYPLLRVSGLFPLSEILDAAGTLQEERRGSLDFRFKNEDVLLNHAQQRILFGWGTYGRNRVFDAGGNDISVTDGYWIIILGIAGIVGFVVSFGVLLWPVVLARPLLRKHGDERDREQLAGLTLIVVLLTIDLIPNGLWNCYPYLLAGILMRRLRELRPTREMAREARFEVGLGST
jgi:hypothetical protein